MSRWQSWFFFIYQGCADMNCEKELEIRNKFGIHARVAAAIVESASKFDCEIFIEKDEVKANARSIMEILMIAASKGDKVRISVSGNESEKAVEEISRMFESGFGEPM
jgi:phosphocarrier protein HPr